MKTLALLVIHVLTMLAQRAGPGGVKAIIAESVLLKHQQLIARRSAGKTPTLTTSDRFLFGFLTLFMRPGRIRKAAVVLKPTTLTKFRRALVSRKYRLLFSSRKNGKPGPKGPSDALVLVIVELKQRNASSDAQESHNRSTKRSESTSTKTWSGACSPRTTAESLMTEDLHGQPSSGTLATAF